MLVQSLAAELGRWVANLGGRLVERNILSLALFAGGCAAPAPPTPARPGLITTESASHKAVVSATSVRITEVAKFTNTTSDKLTLHPCYQHPPYPLTVRLQRYETGEWRTVFSPECTLMLMLNPPRLSPGETRTDTVRLEGFRTANWYPKFAAGPVAGVYRLVYSDVYRTWNADHIGPPIGVLGELVPDSLLVSNSFRIEE